MGGNLEDWVGATLVVARGRPQGPPLLPVEERAFAGDAQGNSESFFDVLSKQFQVEA